MLEGVSTTWLWVDGVTDSDGLGYWLSSRNNLSLAAIFTHVWELVTNSIVLMWLFRSWIGDWNLWNTSRRLIGFICCIIANRLNLCLTSFFVNIRELVTNSIVLMWLFRFWIKTIYFFKAQLIKWCRWNQRNQGNWNNEFHFLIILI